MKTAVLGHIFTCVNNFEERAQARSSRARRGVGTTIRTSRALQVVATELSVAQPGGGGGGGGTNGARPTSARASVTVYMDDVNDNTPRFTSAAYTARLPENATAGVRAITVEATDPDTGPFGSVRYTAVLGHRNASLVLDSQTGAVTVSNDNHGFDREESAGVYARAGRVHRVWRGRGTRLRTFRGRGEGSFHTSITPNVSGTGENDGRLSENCHR